MAIIKQHSKTYGKGNTSNIFTLKIQLKSCREKISELKAQNSNSTTADDKSALESALLKQYARKKQILSKLAKLGYHDNRGRPKKNDNDKYEYSRSKFTAMLLDENLDYLKQLKDSKTIDNISSFLDTLIEIHHETHDKSNLQ